MRSRHPERHRTGRIAWLRAAVLGANDGIVSTASLVLGVAAAHATHAGILVAGAAGLVAGAMSMAAGEYVSVHSQADSEDAELQKERHELHTDNEGEHKELAAIYVGRGLDPALAREVAVQLMAHDALEAHARDELGITEALRARPLQAALASATSFAVGAALPLLVAALARRNAGRPPVWFMRQAGRYHKHYQQLRARHDFIALCKQPELAAEVTMGPIDDFGFDVVALGGDVVDPLRRLVAKPGGAGGADDDGDLEFGHGTLYLLAVVTN